MDKNESTAVAVDPAKIAKKAAYEKELKARKKVAQAKLAQFVKDNAKDLGELVPEFNLLAGLGGEGRSKNPKVPGISKSINAELRTALLDKGSLSEMDIFKQFHIGRPEMVNKARVLVLCPNPADRVWVAFDDKAEVYTVVGTGPEAPAGFTCYIPQPKVL